MYGKRFLKDAMQCNVLELLELLCHAVFTKMFRNYLIAQKLHILNSAMLGGQFVVSPECQFCSVCTKTAVYSVYK